MRKKIISAAVLLFPVFFAVAQTVGYKYTASLPGVTKTGFYNIPITPQLSQHLNIDYADLRIINDSGTWIPHVLRLSSQERTMHSILRDLNFKITENSEKETVIRIANNGSVFSNFVVHLNNTNAQRVVSLSGSDDAQHWFVINDSLVADPLPDAFAGTGSFRVDFPRVNYTFFRLVIYNKGKDPFDIKAVRTAAPASATPQVAGKFFENPVPGIMQKDSAGKSYIRVAQQAAFHFNKISLLLSGSKYFRRLATLYIPGEEGSSFAMPGSPHESFYISSDGDATFYFPPLAEKVFYLVIDNADNPPLRIDTVRTFTGYAFVTSFLEQDKTYRLMMGNEYATAPRYDLEELMKSRGDSALYLNAGEIWLMKQASLHVENKSSRKVLLWTAIIAALGLLLFCTIRMTKEINKKQQDDRL